MALPGLTPTSPVTVDVVQVMVEPASTAKGFKLAPRLIPLDAGGAGVGVRPGAGVGAGAGDGAGVDAGGGVITGGVVTAGAVVGAGVGVVAVVVDDADVGVADPPSQPESSNAATRIGRARRTESGRRLRRPFPELRGVPSNVIHPPVMPARTLAGAAPRSPAHDRAVPSVVKSNGQRRRSWWLEAGLGSEHPNG